MTQLSNDSAARIAARLAPEVCGNCETALPEGCKGTFRDDGAACKLNQCRCGDRLAAACPGEWEPGCDMGNNAAHVRRHTLTLVEKNALDRVLARSVSFVDCAASGAGHAVGPHGPGGAQQCAYCGEAPSAPALAPKLTATWREHLTTIPPTEPLGTFNAMAQGKTDYLVEVLSINGLMTICATEEAVYITREQACAFYGLVPALPLRHDPTRGLRGVAHADAVRIIQECVASAGLTERTLSPEGWNLLHRVTNAAHKAGAEGMRDIFAAGQTP